MNATGIGIRLFGSFMLLLSFGSLFLVLYFCIVVYLFDAWPRGGDIVWSGVIKIVGMLLLGFVAPLLTAAWAFQLPRAHYLRWAVRVFGVAMLALSATILAYFVWFYVSYIATLPPLANWPAAFGKYLSAFGLTLGLGVWSLLKAGRQRARDPVGGRG